MTARVFLFTGTRTEERKGVVSIWMSEHVEEFDLVVVGDCPTGVDREVREWCSKNGVHSFVASANWDFFGTSAGPRRNRAMAALGGFLGCAADGLVYYVAVPGETSKGTFDARARFIRNYISGETL